MKLPDQGRAIGSNLDIVFLEAVFREIVFLTIVLFCSGGFAICLLPVCYLFATWVSNFYKRQGYPSSVSETLRKLH